MRIRLRFMRSNETWGTIWLDSPEEANRQRDAFRKRGVAAYWVWA